MASEGPFPGTHFCASDALVTRVSTFRHTVSVSGWSELGSCPAAGAGTLSGCYEQTSVGATVVCNAGQARLVGNIGGTTIDASYITNTATTAGSAPANTFLDFGSGGLLMLRTTSGTGSGYLMLPEEGPNPGLIVCVSSATLTPGALSDRYTFVLGELGVVGTCPGSRAMSGQMDGCL